MTIIEDQDFVFLGFPPFRGVLVEMLSRSDSMPRNIALLDQTVIGENEIYNFNCKRCGTTQAECIEHSGYEISSDVVFKKNGSYDQTLKHGGKVTVGDCKNIKTGGGTAKSAEHPLP